MISAVVIWPVAQSIYVPIGGLLSLRLAPGHLERTAIKPFDVATAFLVTAGVMALWPVLLALHVADAKSK